MKRSKSDREKRSKMKKKVTNKNISTYIVMLIISLFVMTTCIIVEIETYKEYKVHNAADFEEVEATLNRYESFVDHNITYYSVFYEYVDVHGKVYSGIWRRAIRPEEEAKAMIGKKVKVFYDPKLGICDTNNDKSSAGVIIGATLIAISSISFLISLIKLISYYKKYHKNI